MLCRCNGARESSRRTIEQRQRTTQGRTLHCHASDQTEKNKHTCRKNTRIKTEKHLHKYRTEREMVGLVLVAFSVFAPFAAVGIVAPTSAFISSSPYLLSHCGHPVGCCCCGVPGKETGQTGNSIKQQHRPSGGRTEISPPKTNHQLSGADLLPGLETFREGKHGTRNPLSQAGAKFCFLLAMFVCLPPSVLIRSRFVFWVGGRGKRGGQTKIRNLT